MVRIVDFGLDDFIMATRLNKRHSETCRQRIKTSQLINRLQKHALGKLTKEMTDSQRDAAKFLVSQSMSKPAQTIIQDITTRNANELSDGELADIATGGSAGAKSEKGSSKRPVSVH